MMKKITISLLCALSVLLLCAWGYNEIKLKDNKKLIDLEKCIEFTPHGGETAEESEATETDTNDDTDLAVSEEGSGESVEAINITVSGETIIVDGYTKNENVLRYMLKSRLDKNKNTKAHLTDDFAEAHVYKSVLRVLRDFKEKYGLEFTYE